MASEVKWVFATALFLSAASLSASSSLDLTKIHEHMTDDELFSAFNVKDRAAVPDYEVVPISHERNLHRNRRSIPLHSHNGRYFVTVKNLELYLEPVDHVLLGQNTPVYLASGDESQPLGIRYKRVQKAWPSSFEMYQDPANNAAVSMLKEPDGKVNFEGTIGNDLVIKPLPSRLKNSTLHSHHLLYKKKLEKITMSPDSFFEDSHWSKFFDYVPPRKPQALRAESKVDVVYPEVLVIVDHETYLAHGKSLQALCKYMALFWNAVDLRFRAMREPEVRLNIAGLIVPTDKYGAPYMTYHREGMHSLRISETFDEIGNYLYEDGRFGRKMYDLAVAITNFDLCSTVSDGCNPSTLGLARIGGACGHEDFSDVAVAIVEDHGSFDGVLTAAHEIAHLMGSVHDGEDSYYGPGAENCDGSDGFLMASLTQGSSNGFLWSDCSIQQMQYFLGTGAECLRNKPVTKKPYPKGLPGQLMSRDEQCRNTHGTFECKGFGRDECGELYCRKSGGDRFRYNCVSSRPPAEGSSCGDGGMCLDGKCIRVEEDDNEVARGRRLLYLKEGN